MTVNIFTYVYWPDFFLVNELAEALAAKGHEVAVQTSLPNYLAGKYSKGYSLLKGPYFEVHNNVKIYRHPVIVRRRNFISLFFNYVSVIVIGFFNLIRLPKADVYFFFATSPLLLILPVVVLKKFTKKPLVIWYQDLWPESFFAVTKLSPNHPLKIVLSPFIKFIYNNTDLMLLQNPSFQKNLNEYGYNGKSSVLYNWAPELRATDERPGWLDELPRDRFVITFAGNLGRVQGLTEVLTAAQKIQQIEPAILFAIVGDGSFAAELKTLASYLNLKNVQFYGKKPLADMPALFKQSDALLVSLNDDPAFNLVIPSKLQAYLSAEKPIIGFLNGAGADVIRAASCGVVVPAQNVEALVENVIAVKNLSRDERVLMGLRAGEFYRQNFEKKQSVQALENHLKDFTRRQA